jgi:hypothetical protein
VFSILSNGTFPNLVELDVGNNPCPVFPDDITSLPRCLTKVFAGRIDWTTSDNLTRFVRLVLPHVSVLSLSSAGLPEPEWKRALRTIASVEIRLAALAWDSNPLSRDFLDWLREWRSLRTVSFSDCFPDKKSIDLLSTFFNGSKTIETVILRGGDAAQLADNFAPTLAALSKIPSLTRLDVSHNGIGNSGIDALKNFLMKKPLELVHLDG